MTLLSWVTIVALLAGLACVVYGFIALFLDRDAQKKAEETVSKLNDAAEAAADAATNGGGSGLGSGTTPQAAWSGAGDYVKALAEWSTALSKLRQGVAALVIAFGLIVFAGIAAGIDEKVPDSTEPSADVSSEAAT